METTPEPMVSIKVEKLTRFFGTTAAIRDLSFEVLKGEVVGFLGPNGAGKSTTLRILSGLLPASSGSAVVAGVSVASDSAAVKGKIGYMPENNPLPEDLRVVEYLRLRARLKGVPARRIQQRVDEVMERCDLNRKNRRKLIATLSKGFRQRVGIADAILSEPEVTIMDEPTIGLDPHQVLLIRELIQSLRGTTTVILSSHILSEVEKSCDKVLIINQGLLVASGTPMYLRREFIGERTYRCELKAEAKELLEVAHTVDPGVRILKQQPMGADGFVQYDLGSSHSADLSEALLAQLAARPGLRLRGLHLVEAKLEDVFLAATRRSWEVEMGKVGV